MKASLTPDDELSRMCSRCKEVVPVTSMEKARKHHPPNYCLACRKEMSREAYIKNREKRLIKLREYKKSEAGRLVSRRVGQKAYFNEPEKQTARSRLRYAVKKGWITKEKCEECGEVKVEAHHYLGYDESHWYDVNWLCRKHHRDIHKFSLESRGLL